SCCCSALHLLVPSHLFYWSNEIDPGQSTHDGDGQQDGESPVKVAGSSYDESGECRSHNPCEVADKVLKTRPSSRSLRSRESLGNRPDIGSRDPEEKKKINNTQDQHDQTSARPGGGRQPEESPRQDQATARKR